MSDIEKLNIKLSDPDWKIRAEAVRELEKIDDPGTSEKLASLFNDETWQVRRNVVEAFGNRKEKTALQILKKAFTEETDWRVRQAVPFALGFLGDPRAADTIISGLKDEDWHIRQAAASALEKFPGEESVRALLEALTDKEWHVQGSAAKSLGEIGDLPVVRYLENALKKADNVTRTHIRQALNRLQIRLGLKKPESIDKKGQVKIPKHGCPGSCPGCMGKR